ncbi:MAG: non-ribosomal peptide synthetase, partial [Acidobacteria bacterium]|nr:non-ribosomal peptide synthetase [Acidobacteriota bacterium]
TDAAGSLTHRELWRRARALAARLAALGIGPEQRVGIALERSAEMIVALLATLEAGGAYVPLDLSYPHAHLAYVIADSRMPVLVTRRALAGALPPPGARRLYLDDAAVAGGGGPVPAGAGIRRVRQVLPGNLAYVIYTSGSTGRPKGVAIEHRSAGALVAWAALTFGAGELAGVLAATSICFDLSVFEIFVPLAAGGRVILAGNALELPGLPAADQVSLLNTVPSVLAELLAGARLPASVRTVNLAGEALPRALVDRLAGLPGVDRVYNLYGPSEDTTYSTWARVVPQAAGERRNPPIGRPVDGTRAYLLDRRLQPVPAGVPGEIALAGAGLARGYFGKPELTAERFLPDPFADLPGERLYRTGDLARRLPDGELEFLGRIDAQVKVRGFRIELEEVEAVLGSHPGLRAAVVAVRRGRLGPEAPGAAPEAPATGADALLAAYVVPDPAAAPSPGELRRFMAERLPAFMVPGAFVTLTALPLTPSGKVDRRALPEPAAAPADREGLADAYVPAETPVEHQLVAIWREVLGVPRVGIHDNFFELGGHSFHAARVLARVQELFGARVPLRGLLEDPTVAGLTVAIAEEMLRQAEPEAVSEVLEEIE